MRRNYDEEPCIQPFINLEEGTRQYWEASRAWKGHPTNQKWSIGRLFEVLHPLKMQGRSHALRTQAEDLASLIVENKLKRPSTTLGQVITLRQSNVTQNSDPQVKVA